MGAESEMTEQQFLAHYKKKEYPKPSLTADVCIFKRTPLGGLQLLMIRRGNHPFMDCWALPGGFSQPGESIDQTAARELEEETCVQGIPLDQLGMYSTPGRDPRGWTVSQAYVAVIDGEVPVRAGDDAAQAAWFDVCFSAGANGIEDDSYKVDLTCEGEALQVAFSRQACAIGGRHRAQLIEQEGLAFDHGAIVADAVSLLVGEGIVGASEQGA